MLNYAIPYIFHTRSDTKMASPLWRSMLLICSLFLVATEAISSSELCARYPKQINVDQLYNRSDHFISNDSLPFINSRDYLALLAQGASLCDVTLAVFVVGPKNSGKSEGFKQIIPMWKESSHIVLDVDLKGSKSNVASQDFMWYVANKVTEVFYSLDYHAQRCVFGKLQYNHDCVNSRIPWWSRVMISDCSLILNTIVVVAALAAVGIRIFARSCLSQAILFLFLTLLAYFCNWYVVVEFAVHLIRESIASGDWDALTCSCNVLSECVPERRPIVIVREITNLNPESLNAFLRSLERIKQGDIHYPVFVESSDFQWENQPPVFKSRDSFITYHLKEMTREEGLAEVVHKLKIWTEEEYELIYDTIRGHLGSYMLLYDYNKVKQYSLNESIWRLKERAYDQVLRTVTVHAPRENCTAINNQMLSLKKNDYNETIAVVPDEIGILFETNILFRDSKYIYPQNRLLEYAIDDYISDFLGH